MENIYTETTTLGSEDCISSLAPTHSHVHMCVSNNDKEKEAVKSVGEIKGVGGLKRGEENDVVQWFQLKRF